MNAPDEMRQLHRQFYKYMKTEYCLPLGSDYLNRQSATFFRSC